MKAAVVEKKTFSDLYLREYDKAVSVDDKELRELVSHDFGEPTGNILRSLDKHGRRLVIIVGDGHNIVVHDRYPGIPVKTFGVKAINVIHQQIPAIITDQYIPFLMEMAFLDC